MKAFSIFGRGAVATALIALSLVFSIMVPSPASADEGTIWICAPGVDHKMTVFEASFYGYVTTDDEGNLVYLKESWDCTNDAPPTEEPTLPPVTEEPTLPPVTEEPTLPPVTEEPTLPPVTEIPTDPATLEPTEVTQEPTEVPSATVEPSSTVEPSETAVDPTETSTATVTATTTVTETVTTTAEPTNVSTETPVVTATSTAIVTQPAETPTYVSTEAPAETPVAPVDNGTDWQPPAPPTDNGVVVPAAPAPQVDPATGQPVNGLPTAGSGPADATHTAFIIFLMMLGVCYAYSGATVRKN